MSGQQTDTGIEAIVGEPLSGVAFVQDYVEFHFDGKIVRSLTMPAVMLGATRHTYPEAGSRDALCSLIGLAVEKVKVKEGDQIEIIFSGGAELRVPLTAEARNGPEAAHYVSGTNQPIQVW